MSAERDLYERVLSASLSAMRKLSAGENCSVRHRIIDRSFPHKRSLSITHPDFYGDDKVVRKPHSVEAKGVMVWMAMASKQS